MNTTSTTTDAARDAGQTIKNAVREFMGTRRVCYATPGTDRHSSNFYGDTHVCRFTRSELQGVIEMFHKNYGGGVCVGPDEVEGAMTLQESCDRIIGDMQFDCPE